MGPNSLCPLFGGSTLLYSRLGSFPQYNIYCKTVLFSNDTIIIMMMMSSLLQNIGSESENRPAVLILANKSDLKEERKIEKTTGEEVARDFGAHFAEISARTGHGVQEVRVIALLTQWNLRRIDTLVGPILLSLVDRLSSFGGYFV